MDKSIFSHADIGRFYAKVVKKDCWEWVGCKFHYGHGVFRHRGKNLKAHRVMAALEFGMVPDDKNVNHICDNPSCVNPKHIYIGTQKENAQDMARRGRAKGVPPCSVGENNPNAKINGMIAKEIYNYAWAGENQRLIAEKYGISTKLVSAIKTGVAWKHATKGGDSV